MFNLLKILLMVIGLGTCLVYGGRLTKEAFAWTTNKMMDLAIDAQQHQMSYSWWNRQLMKPPKKPKEGGSKMTIKPSHALGIILPANQQKKVRMDF